MYGVGFEGADDALNVLADAAGAPAPAILRVILRVMRTRLRTPQSALMMLPAPTVVYAMYLWSPVAIVTLGSTGSARLPRSQNCIQMTVDAFFDMSVDVQCEACSTVPEAE